MSGTPSTTTGWYPEHIGTALPPGATAPMQANAQAGLGQPVYYDGSGNVALEDGTHPGLIPAGAVNQRLAGANPSVAGQEVAMLHTGYGGGAPASAVSNDGFGVADVLTACFDAGSGVPGKLSNAGGNDRSFMGLVLGLIDGINPRTWIGPVASLLARALHSLNNETGGNAGYAADASASTDLGAATGGPPPTTLSTIGFMLARPKRRSIVTSVEIIPSAALAASGGTNYRVIQLWKVDTTGTVALAASPLIATFTTSTQALVAGQPTAFTLAGSGLTLRETDVLVGTSIHYSSGATVPLSVIRANAKVV